jgi:hypothetical protein
LDYSQKMIKNGTGRGGKEEGRREERREDLTS